MEEHTPDIVDLAQLLSRICGGPQFEETERMAAIAQLLPAADHLVFVLVDGLGLNLSPHFPRNGFFATSLRTELRSVFPSTTAAALTSIASGSWPAEHGLTGWWTYFREEGRVLCPLTFVERATGENARRSGLSLRTLIPVRSMYGTFSRQTRVFLPQRISRGEYAGWTSNGTRIVAFGSYDDAAIRVTQLVRRARRPTFTYVYLPDVDNCIHKRGTRHPEVAAAVAEADRLLGRLVDALPPSALLIATADHGLVDVPPDHLIQIADGDPLLELLEAPPSGEDATPQFHLREGMDTRFRELFDETGLSQRFELVSREEAELRRLYGPRPLSEAMRTHAGDYVGLAQDPWLLQYVPPGREPVRHLGVHGGLRQEEMRIGLFAASGAGQPG